MSTLSVATSTGNMDEMIQNSSPSSWRNAVTLTLGFSISMSLDQVEFETVKATTLHSGLLYEMYDQRIF